MDRFSGMKERELPDYAQNAVAVLRFDNGAGVLCFPMHWHDRMELIRVRQGSLNVFLGESQSFRALPGEVVIFCPQQIHRGVAGSEGVSYDVVMFELSSFFNNVPAASAVLRQIAASKLLFAPATRDSNVVSAFDAVFSSHSAGLLESVGTVYALLGQLLQHCEPRERTPLPGDERFSEVVAYVNDHYTEPLTTGALSARFGYDEAYFCRRFKRFTGIPPLKYLEILRLEAARDLLRNTGLPVSRIALQCGFGDICYFSSRFHRHFGLSPSACRKQWQ